MKLAEARERTVRILKSQAETKYLQIPCLMGKVGVGKTSLVYDIAKEVFSLPVVEIHLGDDADPSGVTGIALPSGLLTKDVPTLVWGLNEAIELAMSQPVVLFLDEIDKGPPPVQNGALSLTGKREVRNRPLHPNTLLVAAGNRVQDSLFANRFSHALRTRVKVLEIDDDPNGWCAWGKDTGRIHELIIGYIRYQPNNWHNTHEGIGRFPTPRCWEEASVEIRLHLSEDKLLEDMKQHSLLRAILEDNIGIAASNDFMAWFDFVKSIDTDGIVYNGKVDPPKDLTKGADATAKVRTWHYAAIFAVSRFLSNKAVSKTMVGLEPFVTSLDREMRLAWWLQLPSPVQSKIAQIFPKVSAKAMEGIIK